MENNQVRTCTQATPKLPVLAISSPLLLSDPLRHFDAPKPHLPSSTRYTTPQTRKRGLLRTSNLAYAPFLRLPGIERWERSRFCKDQCRGENFDIETSNTIYKPGRGKQERKRGVQETSNDEKPVASGLLRHFIFSSRTPDFLMMASCGCRRREPGKETVWCLEKASLWAVDSGIYGPANKYWDSRDLEVGSLGSQRRSVLLLVRFCGTHVYPRYPRYLRYVLCAFSLTYPGWL